MNKHYIFLLSFVALILSSCTQSSIIDSGKWKVSYDSENQIVDIENNSELIFNNIYASYKLGDRTITTKDYITSNSKTFSVNDDLGKGSVLEITYTAENMPKMIQSFYVYTDKNYVLTDFTIENEAGDVATNYMAPVNIDEVGTVLTEGDNRALFIPFDNDAWVRFESHPLTFDKLRSYEATAIFNNTDRDGIIIGSVEHTDWKTAIDMSKGDLSNIGSLICYGGVADSLTRDSKAHGTISGKKVKSPKVMIGYFNDWREGLEAYGKANAIIAPRREWTKAVPFGWNSWGVLQFNLTYQKALDVSDYFKENIQNNNFVNPDNTVYIGLDSGWTNFTEEELKAFVAKCKANGQKAGIYWTPFTDWGKDLERAVDDVPEYKYKDIYVYANGKPQEFDGAYAVDPTHPAIEQKMKLTSELFRRCGFEYVKMDFMTHGAMEGDKWHNPEIKTGIQAYNNGMALLDKYFSDMFINLSISPIFPANYAQSRRIACDAWNKIKDTEYTMNAVSYGWWIDNVYQFNDADHIVLKDATEGENRARVTSSVITGLYIAGDDYSKEGMAEGKEKSKTYLTNADINAIATGRSFRPVEGIGTKSENQFIHTDDKGNTYYIVFNYDDQNISFTPSFDRLDLDTDASYTIKELWSGDDADLKASIIIPSKDVRVYKITKNTVDK